MLEIVSHAIAKVNLMLNIIGKNDDGYHKIESVFAFLNDIYDELIIYPEIEFNEDSAQIDGVEKNSIKIAAGILKQHFKLKVPHVVVKKNLPFFGGIGGGSSDSACFVNSVFDLWGFNQCEKLKYIDIFHELGSDAKVFLYKYFTNSRFLYINGTGLSGDIFPIKINTENSYVLIANNGTKLSTKDVFQNFHEEFSQEYGLNKINFDYLKKFQNSLQVPAIKLESSLEEVISDIKSTGATFCGVSGSGSTCFGLYEEKKLAESAKTTLSKYSFVEISQI